MLRFNKTINNGPPTIAIIIADEISYGAMITLPRVSALNNVIAPSNIQIGIKYLWSFPINNLEMCGTKRPIKPMTPTTATLILHNNTASKDKPKRYKFTLIPSEINVRSSKLNKLQALAINNVISIIGNK